jgi:hypothetical protein
MQFQSWNNTHQVKHRDFHHTLVEVCRLILDHFHCDNLLGFQVLAFNHLTEGTLAENVENEISVPNIG